LSKQKINTFRAQTTKGTSFPLSSRTSPIELTSFKYSFITQSIVMNEQRESEAIEEKDQEGTKEGGHGRQEGRG
jgi:hypothetical protein